jgi:hypothetical protein
MGQVLQQVTHDLLLPSLKAFKGTSLFCSFSFIAHSLGATADVCLVLPIMRQLYGWIGCVSAKEQRLMLEAQSMAYSLAAQ